MSEIKKLIERLCPDGVEYKKLGELCDIKGRIGFRGYTRQDLVDESNGAISLSPSNIINGNLKFEKCTYVSWDKYYESPEIMAQEGDIVFTKTASVGKTALIKTLPKETTINPQLVLLKHIKCNNAFLSYFLKGDYFQNEVRKITGIGSVPNVPQSSLAAIEIPVPPIEVQSKIVEILDNFTELEAELEIKLEAELEARRKQYEYYRNQLLTFDKVGGVRFDVKWMKMSDIGTFTRGKRFVRTDIVEDGVPCIHYGDMYTYYGLKADKAKTHLTPEKAQKMRFAKKNDVVIVGAGENKNDIGVGVAWLGEEDVAVHDACYIFSSDLYPQYVSHFLRTELYHKQIYPLVSEGKICSISAQSIGRAIIPIPPLEEQKRIVSILDRFEALTTDLQSGLPAEIEARRKQYEYYREKLLTFKRKIA